VYWTKAVADRLLAKDLKLAGFETGRCQPVYVDDLVTAILTASTQTAAVGQAFNIAGEEVVSWAGFFTAMAKAMGLEPIQEQSRRSADVKVMLMRPIRSLALLVRDRFPGLVKLATRFEWSGRLAKKAEGKIKRSLTSGELDLYDRTAVYPIDKAKDLLGYVPAVSLERGMELTALWLAHSGYNASR
ncbi:MAG: hypothetical protein OEX97_12150, partial [Acidimicrobiia bacterium]|nr:hypothetical protein [Acidimicrobiia bacterium]